MATKPHGGKRQGAGRKPAAGTTRQAKISVTLTADQKAWLVARPEGASATVRELIDMARMHSREGASR